MCLDRLEVLHKDKAVYFHFLATVRSVSGWHIDFHFPTKGFGLEN